MGSKTGDAHESGLRPGTVLELGNVLRPRLFKSPELHARQRHSGAPWHPDYVDETIALKGNRLPYHDRSEFDSVELIDEAIKKAEYTTGLIGKNGNILIFVDFGHEVGFDALRRRRTSVVTVVAYPVGEVITVFPGRPKDSAIPTPLVGSTAGR